MYVCVCVFLSAYRSPFGSVIERYEMSRADKGIDGVYLDMRVMRATINTVKLYANISLVVRAVIFLKDFPSQLL